LGSKCTEADRNLHRQILDFCRRVAGSGQIIAVSLFDYCSMERTRSKGAMEAIVVIRDFAPRIMSYVRVVSGRTVVVVAVDQWIFQRDVERGFLGEATAGILIFPYVSLIGDKFLRSQEIMLKKRLILELLENLSVNFPELSDRMRIKPEYFMYEVLLNRVRVFPPLANCVSSFMREAVRGEKPPTLDGYVEALRQLGREGKVKVSAEYVTVPKRIISRSTKSRILFANLSRKAPRTLFTPIFEVFPQLLNLFSQNTQTFPRFQKLGQWKKNLDDARVFVDPQKYVFVPTARGLVSLADRLDVGSFAREELLDGANGRVNVENVGGVLNDVYLLRTSSVDEEKRVIVKRFKDWSGFKWFPLNLWSLGTRTFAVLGRSRLERECGIGEFLRSEGFNVPKILHISHSKRLVFMEYLEGENLTNAIKRIANCTRNEVRKRDLETLSRVGGTLAKVHSLNVALGDTKPENVIVRADGRIFLLDFEQASRGGDASWDVAEFLYFSGHYLPPLQGSEKAKAIANAFIDGYLKAGGSASAVKKAGTTKYTRIFSLFTAPSVLVAMAAECKKVSAQR
jgi:tRNA A-37 threonylcarbamoyl transferase component Bud32